MLHFHGIYILTAEPAGTVITFSIIPFQITTNCFLFALPATSIIFKEGISVAASVFLSYIVNTYMFI